MKLFGLKPLSSEERGLTIVELTITLPISAIIVVSLISILFSQYGSVLAESTRANLRASGQALLTSLQDELLFTIEYGHDLHTDLTDPYAPSGGWTYNTTPQTLIINETALDGARADSNRNIVREELTNCASTSITDNPVAINNLIYFTEDNPDNTYLNLRRRTVTPTFSLCSIDRVTGDPCSPETVSCLDNARDTTCPVANVGSGACVKQDTLLSGNVIEFTVRYYESNNILTPFPSAAEKIEIDLVLGDNVYGRDVEVEVNHTIRKIN